MTFSWCSFDIPEISGKTVGAGSYINISIGFPPGVAHAYSLDIAQVQLEVGSKTTVFEKRPQGVELALCQRYFFKTYPQNISPGTPTIEGQMGSYVNNMPRSTYMVDVPVQFPVTMRDVPTTIVYDKNGTPGCCDTAIGSGHPASAVRHGDGGCVIRCTYNAASTAIFCYFNMIADTEL